MRETSTLTRRSLISAAPAAIVAATVPALAAEHPDVALLEIAAPATPLAAPSPDMIFAQIELHKALRIVANNVPGDVGDPTYDAAQEDEEAALQALADIRPSSIAAAAAQLTYMAEVEGDFTDKLSPFLRTVRTAAEALTALSVGLSS